jgi:hypothetical protein
MFLRCSSSTTRLAQKQGRTSAPRAFTATRPVQLYTPALQQSAWSAAQQGTVGRKISTTVCMAEKLDKSTPDSAWKKVLSAQEASGSSVVAGVAAAADYFHLQAGCSSAWTRMVFASRGCTQRVTWQAWWYEFGSCFFPAAIAVCNLLLLQHTPGVRPCKTVCNGIVDPGNVSCGVCVWHMWCVCVCACVSCSSTSCVRRGPSPLALASTTSSTSRAYTNVQAVAHPCTSESQSLG